MIMECWPLFCDVILTYTHAINLLKIKTLYTNNYCWENLYLLSAENWEYESEQEKTKTETDTTRHYTALSN